MHDEVHFMVGGQYLIDTRRIFLFVSFLTLSLLVRPAGLLQKSISVFNLPYLISIGDERGDDSVNVFICSRYTLVPKKIMEDLLKHNPNCV